MISALRTMKEREVQAFKLSDSDGDNQLSRMEVTAMLQREYGMVDASLIREMFAKYSRSHKDMLTLNEYNEALEYYKHDIVAAGDDRHMLDDGTLTNFPPIK